MLGKVVDTPFLCVREERKQNQRIVVLLQEGAEVYIDPLYVDPDWYKVTTMTGCEGWAQRKYVALKE